MWDKMPKLIRQQPTEGPDGAVRLVLEGAWRLDYLNVRREDDEWVTDVVVTPKEVD